jgi:uncharacterized protein (UPF0248 family)
MIPIHEFLNRIKWDPGFGAGDFQLGYFDRVENEIKLVPFRHIEFPPDESHTFQLIAPSGETQRVPFHRVREVYKDGRSIWHRPPRPAEE